MNYTLGQIKEVLVKKNYLFFDDIPFMLNLIGIRESMEVNKFNDEYYVIYKDEELRTNINCFPFTTKPGKYWLNNPLNKDGCAIVVPEQYVNLWSIGLHKGRPALVQVNNIKVYRDSNKNDIFDTDPSTIEEGMFGINQHGSNLETQSEVVDKWSAACQVTKIHKDQDTLQELYVKAATLTGDHFTYTLLEKSDFI